MRTDRLELAMKEAGLNQSSLARAVNSTQGAIAQILDGSTKNSRLLPDIAETLRVPLRWLRGQSDDRGPAAENALSLENLADQLGLSLVPEIELGYSMGGGSVLEDYRQVGFQTFKRDWLRGVAHGNLSDLFVARADGDSMMPTLLDGDMVMIDMAQKRITQQDRIWALSYGDLGMIKRVRREPSGNYVLMSDNPAVSPISAADDEMYVVGRVVWIARRT